MFFFHVVEIIIWFQTAPKIGESNIGFKMLASMGWSEGDRIGMTGGLDAPLTAVIKHTKLGLGASKVRLCRLALLDACELCSD
jgi:hypothetical protein